MAVPPDFVAGQVLTAAQMNQIGLWLVKTQTIGTAVSSVTVTGAFTADYHSYLIRVIGGTASTSLSLNMTLGSTVTGYYYGGSTGTYAGGAPASFAQTNATSFIAAGSGETSGLSCRVELNGPQLADETGYVNLYNTYRTTGSGGMVAGYLNDTTSYTAFTLTTTTGTITGGTIYVYGMRD